MNYARLYKNDEERRVADILIKLILALLPIYLVVVGTALFWHDWFVISVALISVLLLVVPLLLLLRGRLRAGGMLVVLILLATTTVLATIGQGIHDQAMVAYPVIITFAGLVMRRGDFFFSALLALLAMAWLAFGEAGGLFVSKTYETPGLSEFVLAAFLLAIAILAVDMLAHNMRESVRQARQEIDQRKSIEAQLRHQSIHDGLTGIYNRFFFEEELARLDKSLEFPISIIMADVDGLKTMNDTRGHAVGDQMLQEAARMLRSVFRAEDVLARIGGDEFSILLPHTDAETAQHLLARVRHKLEEHNAGRPGLRIGLSLGAATAEQGKLLEALVSADRHMYADKARRKSQANPELPA